VLCNLHPPESPLREDFKLEIPNGKLPKQGILNEKVITGVAITLNSKTTY
jgi:hypothetical protein